MHKRVTLFFVLFLIFFMKTIAMISMDRNIQLIVLDCFLTTIFYGTWCFAWGMKKGVDKIVEDYTINEETLDEIP